MATIKWNLKYDGRDYYYDPDKHLTVGRLRQIKQWFPQLGTWNAFNQGFYQGDPDVLACIIWIVRNANDEKGVPEPNMIPDFSVGEFMDSFHDASVVEDEDPEGEPQPPAGGDQTPDSSGTSTSSETDISDSSLTSAT